MRYLPHTSEDITTMLRKVGLNSLDALFAMIPEECRRTADLNLPEPLSEWELNAHMDALAGSMAVSPQYKIFLGSGSYDHYIPEAVKHLLSRSEVYTAYTPYQPEISQGTLQAIYEYQTLITRLLGMEVTNASLYDGASSLAEALLMAIRTTRRNKVAISRLIHPSYRRVVQTYFAPTGCEVVELPYLPNGRTDLTGLDKLDELAAVAVQSPNFFGCVEDLKNIGEKVHVDEKTLFVTCFTEPLAYGMLKSPGSCGADIACGEGQSLGIPRSFGGPGLGVFATKNKYVRNMPGRLIGQTTDKNGKRGFVLTLATREQHIRREKATSNICSNQGLCATAATMYMAFVGGTGFRELAALNRDKAHYLKGELQNLFRYLKAFFRIVGDPVVLRQPAGLPLVPYFPELANHYVFCVTETSSKADMDALVKEVQS